MYHVVVKRHHLKHGVMILNDFKLMIPPSRNDVLSSQVMSVGLAAQPGPAFCLYISRLVDGE